jgi:hypothetical protein
VSSSHAKSVLCQAHRETLDLIAALNDLRRATYHYECDLAPESVRATK